jgi:hypothetical protein
MDPRNNDDINDLLAEDIYENYETSPIPPSPGSGFLEGNIGDSDDDFDLMADEQLDSFIIENHLNAEDLTYEYKATFNNFKVNIQCLRQMLKHDLSLKENITFKNKG